MSELTRSKVNIALLTVSDTRDETNDKSGKLLADRLMSDGHNLYEKSILPDDIYMVRAQIASWIADSKIQTIISTGGTGLTGRDGTPEAATPLFDKNLLNDFI